MTNMNPSWRLTPWYLRLLGYPRFRRVVKSDHNCMGWGNDWRWEYQSD